MRIVFALVAATALTFGAYAAATVVLDQSVARATTRVVNDPEHADAVQATLALWSAYAAAKNAEEFEAAQPNLPDADSVRGALANVLGYGRTNRPAFMEAVVLPGVPIPVREIVSATEREMISALQTSCKRLAAELTETDAPCADDATVRTAFAAKVSPQISVLADKFRSTPPYTIRRYISGPIQFSTVWLVFTGLALLLSVFNPWFKLEARAMRRPPRVDLSFPYDGSDPEFGSIPKAPILRDASGEAYAKWLAALVNRHRLDSLGVLHAAVRAFMSENSVDAAARAADSRLQDIEDQTDSWLESVRYIVWAVPAVGFIGTVVGVGDAMIKADRIVGAGLDASAQRTAIQSITTDLGTAFDTTLVALIGSVFLMAAYHYSVRQRQRYLSVARHAAFELLIPQMQGLSLEKIFTDLVEQTLRKVVRKIFVDAAGKIDPDSDAGSSQ